jgi:hypothetical protein
MEETAMPIPKTKACPVNVLSGKKILLHAPPKFGKSSFSAGIPDAIFLATEPGLGSLETMRWEDENGNYVITNWETLLTATKEVVESKRFKTIVLDTIDLAFELCRDWVCQKHGEEYYTDGKLGYGKGTSLVNNEMRRYLTRLNSLNLGVVLLAHSVMETVDTRTGEIQRAVPNLPEKVRRPILGAMDFIFYGDFELDEKGERRIPRRVLRTKPNPAYEAGDRTGRLPNTLPMDWGALKEAFETVAPNAVAAPA